MKCFPDEKQMNRNSKRLQWLTPIILATQDEEIRRIMVQSQPGKIVILKNLHKNRTGGVAQGEDPEFKKRDRNWK
jgi:hypothetical protein